jgi:hypothetical protein
MKSINLTCRKGEDFYITSSEVEMDKNPELNESNIMLWMTMTAGQMLTQGYDIEIKQYEV